MQKGAAPRTFDSIDEVLAYFVLRASPSEQTAFFCSYRSFLDPPQLLEKCLASYDTYTLASEPSGCSKVVSFLQKWAETCFQSDFKPRPKMMDRLVVWMSNNLEGDNDLKMIFIKKQQKSDFPEVNPLPVPSGGITMNHKFLDWHKNLIAEHMTLIEAEIYNRLRPHEFIDLAWQKENKEELAPSLVRMADRFNSVSFWVAATIIYGPTPPYTTQMVLCKWLNVAWKLWRMGNFQTMMAIVAGLNHGAVQRMKKEWGSLPQKYQERWHSLDEVFNPLGGYKNYREALVKSTSSNVIPYMPSILGDLAMQSVGNPTFVEGKVNVDKIEMVGARIYDALRFQPATYKVVRKDPSLVMYFCSTSLNLTEDDLYNESKLREPLRTNTTPVAASKLRRSSISIMSSPGIKGSKTPADAMGKPQPKTVSRIFGKTRTRSGSVLLRPSASPPTAPPTSLGNRRLPDNANTTSPALLASQNIKLPSKDKEEASSGDDTMSSATAVDKGSGKEEQHQQEPMREDEGRPAVAPIPVIKPESISMENLGSLSEAKSKILTLSREESTTRLSRSGSWPPVAATWKPEMAPEDSIPISSLIMPAERELEKSKSKEEEEYDEMEESDSSITTSATASTEDTKSSERGAAGGNKVPPVRALFPSSSSPAQVPPAPMEIMTHRASQSQIDRATTLRKSKDLVKWTEDDVGIWLESIGLKGYVEGFKENSITGADLADLTDDDLSDLGVVKIGHKKVLILGIAELLQLSDGLIRTPRTVMLSPRGGSGAGTSPSRSPRGNATMMSPRGNPALLSPRKTSAGSPRTFASPRPVNSLFVKLKYHGKVSVIEVKRNLSYGDLVIYCTNKIGRKVKTIHYIDPDGEPILLKGEKEFRFLIDQSVSVNFSVVVNRGKQKGSSIRRKK